MKLTALAGGTGAAKLLRGLCSAMPPEDLTVVVNTGDDAEFWGLHVSPDLDTITYALADRLDLDKGWGVRDDSFQCLGTVGLLGLPTYFALGDKDLAVHIYRTKRLRDGVTLSSVSDEVRRAFGVKPRILPMSDAPVRTRVQTPVGWVAFQEYFVRERCQPEVIDVAYEGASHAQAGPGVVEAIEAADGLLICPSNPISSIGPILALEAVTRAWGRRRSKAVAVSPVVGGAAVSGPAGKMLRAKGHDLSPMGVLDVYQGLVDAMLIDQADAELGPLLEARGVEPKVTKTLMRSREEETTLARFVLKALS